MFNETSPNARIQVMPIPVAAPGKCAICGYAGQDGERNYIDIGLDLDFYGVVYFCTHCFTETANQLGYGSPDQVAGLLKDKRKLTDDVIGLAHERDSLRRALESVFNGSPGISAGNESAELPKPTPASKRPTPRKLDSAKVAGPNDSSNSDSDVISLG